MTAAQQIAELQEVRALLLEIRGGMIPSMTPGADKRIDDAVSKIDKVIATVPS